MIIPDGPVNRLCPNGFFDEYLRYTQFQRSPEDFHLWVAVNLVSTALGRRCYIDQGYFKVYPNTYVVLVAESANLSKSTCINIGIKLLQEACPNLEFFSQKGTAESLIHHLSLSFEEFDVAECNLTIPEFATFFGNSKMDPALMHLITDYYDSPDNRSYTTIARGKEIVNNICLNVMAGTTIEWMRSCIPTAELGGGFIARLLMVHRSSTPRDIAFPGMMMGNPEVEEAKRRCLNDLQSIYKLQGEFTYTNKGKGAFLEWFSEYKDKQHGTPIMRGYYGRKDTSLLKLAMVSSASKTNSMIIDEKDILYGLTMLAANEESMIKVSEGLGQTEVGRRLDLVYRKIQKAGIITQSMLMSQLTFCMNSREMAEVIDTLRKSGKIKSKNDGGRRVYSLNEGNGK